MKPLIICLLIPLLELSVTSQEVNDFPFEENEKWDIDMNDMLNFEKSFGSDYSRESIKRNTNNFDEAKSSAENSLRKTADFEKNYNDLQDVVELYIRRYINLFLVRSGLQDIQKPDEDIKLTFDFFIEKNDLIFLHKLKDGKSEKKVQDIFYTLDNILDRGLFVKQETLTSTLLSFVYDFISDIAYSIFYCDTKIVSYFLIVCIILVTSYFFNGSLSNIVLIFAMLNSFIVLEGILDYQGALKRVEIENDLKLAMNRMDVCDPNKKSFWSSVAEYFTGDKCLEYRLAMAKVENQKISPIKCILEAYNTILLQYPFMVLGSAIRTFSENINASMPMQWLWGYATSMIIVFLLIGIFAVGYLKLRIRFSFFGAALDFGSSSANPALLTHDIRQTDPLRIREVQSTELRSITGTGENAETEKENGLEQKAKNSTTVESVEGVEGESDPATAEENRVENVEDVKDENS